MANRSRTSRGKNRQSCGNLAFQGAGAAGVEEKATDAPAGVGCRAGYL